MRVLHLVDEAAGWEQRIAIRQLLERLDSGPVSQSVASVAGRAPSESTAGFNGTAVAHFPIRMGLPITSAPAIGRLLDRDRIDVVHAWGVQAAFAVQSSRIVARGLPLLVHRFDPRITPSEAKALRTLSDAPGFAMACATDTVRRRVLESGVPASACVVIRPGVDFRRINEAKKDRTIRAGLGVGASDSLVVAAHPVTPDGGHDRVLWCAYLRHYVDPTRKMLFHGESRAFRRLKRLARTLPTTEFVVWTDERDAHYEDLIAVADALVITPNGDVSATPIAWAMAAGVPVIGSAVYSVAEFISHNHNGVLIKPDASPSMSIKLTKALDRLGGLGQEREAARGQAFDVFSVRRFADQALQLYDNLFAGDPLDRGITDPAVV